MKHQRIIVTITIVAMADMTVIVGRLVTHHCPSVSGCRAVVEFKDATDLHTIELADDQLRIGFNGSSHTALFLVIFSFLITADWIEVTCSEICTRIILK